MGEDACVQAWQLEFHAGVACKLSSDLHVHIWGWLWTPHPPTSTSQVLEYKDSRLGVYRHAQVWITSQTLQTWCLSTKFLYPSHSVAGIVFISCPGRIGSWRHGLISEPQSSQCLSNLITALQWPWVRYSEGRCFWMVPPPLSFLIGEVGRGLPEQGDRWIRRLEYFWIPVLQRYPPWIYLGGMKRKDWWSRYPILLPLLLYGTVTHRLWIPLLNFQHKNASWRLKRCSRHLPSQQKIPDEIPMRNAVRKITGPGS